MTQIKNTSAEQMANAIRFLSMDAVQQANSGHPGAPMGMAEIAVALWDRHLKHNPNDPNWCDRDRFVLSNGHGSMLIYSLLYLTGYDLSIEELKNFRQLHSKTAGHPEYGITPGVETTTGPLGQGISNAVGMALAEDLLAREFNTEEHKIVDHYTYVFLGDGCLMEGISHEACSFAGTFQLNKLIALWDDNGISIDGDVEHWCADDTPARFEAYGWNVIRDVNGHDIDAVDMAIVQAKSSDKPTLICCKTTIGKGSPNKQGGHDVHGAPLGEQEIVATRKALNWPHEPFVIPQEVLSVWDATDRGSAVQNQWQQTFDAYAEVNPKKSSEFTRRMNNGLPADLDEVVHEYIAQCNKNAQTVASRKASQMAISALAPVLPEFLGGSADLTGSNNTNWPDCTLLRAGNWGNHISYGVREFGMSAIMNGVALHGGYLPFGGTFLTFSDYSRNALRMAALMGIRSIFVFTHDSIGLGEDGPTHQSVEHISSLRIMPNMDVWRPADTVETGVAWGAAVARLQGPTSLIFSRQNLEHQIRDGQSLTEIQKGGYVLHECVDARATLIATGSEVQLAVKTAKAMQTAGTPVRVVSMPCTQVFDRQDDNYKNQVLGDVPRVAIETGITDYWYKYGCKAVVGIDTYGESAPATELFEHFGFTTDKISEVVNNVI